MTNLTHDAQFIRAATAAAAGTSTITTSIIDLKAFDGCVFMASLGDVADTAEVALTVQHGDEADGSDMANTAVAIVFTADATSADNGLLIAEIFRPNHRYVRAVLTRGVADAALDGILAILTDPKQAPVTQGDDVLAKAFGLSPD